MRLVTLSLGCAAAFAVSSLQLQAQNLQAPNLPGNLPASATQLAPLPPPPPGNLQTNAGVAGSVGVGQAPGAPATGANANLDARTNLPGNVAQPSQQPAPSGTITTNGQATVPTTTFAPNATVGGAVGAQPGFNAGVTAPGVGVARPGVGLQAPGVGAIAGTEADIIAPTIVPTPGMMQQTVPGQTMPTGPNGWRYYYQGSRWWYYTPGNQWVYYNGGQWSTPIAAGTRVQSGYRAGSLTPGQDRRIERRAERRGPVVP